MAYACFKALIRDEVHRMSDKAIEQLIAGGRSSHPPDRKPLPHQSHTVHNPDPATHSFEASRATATNARVKQERTKRERGDQQQAEQERGVGEHVNRQHTGKERTKQEPSATAEKVIAKASYDGHSTVTDASTINTNPISHSDYKAPEVREASSLNRLLLSGARPGGSSAQNIGNSTLGTTKTNRKLFEVVRLRVYYSSAIEVTPINALARPASPTRLIVLRDSAYGFPGPRMFEFIGRASAIGADRNSEGYIFSDEVGQVWDARDQRGFAWTSMATAALQRNLRRVFLRRPLDPPDRERFIVQRIPIDSVGQYLNPAMSCTEVIGIIDRDVYGDPKVVCLGFAALARDDFCRVVISAVEKLVATNRP